MEQYDDHAETRRRLEAIGFRVSEAAGPRLTAERDSARRARPAAGGKGRSVARIGAGVALGVAGSAVVVAVLLATNRLAVPVAPVVAPVAAEVAKPTAAYEMTAGPVVVAPVAPGPTAAVPVVQAPLVKAPVLQAPADSAAPVEPRPPVAAAAPTVARLNGSYAPVIRRLRRSLPVREAEADPVMAEAPAGVVAPAPPPASASGSGSALAPPARAVDGLAHATVIVHVPYRNPGSEAFASGVLGRFASRVGRLEMTYVTAGPSAFEVGYFHPGDAAAARELAEQLLPGMAWRLRDLSAIGGGTAPDTFEVWLPAT